MSNRIIGTAIVFTLMIVVVIGAMREIQYRTACKRGESLKVALGTVAPRGGTIYLAPGNYVICDSKEQ